MSAPDSLLYLGHFVKSKSISAPGVLTLPAQGNTFSLDTVQPQGAI